MFAERGPSGTGHDTAGEHVCGPDCQCGCAAGLTIGVPRVTEAAPARRCWNVTLYEGGFTVDADDEHEARIAALHTVAESLDLFEVAPDQPVAVPGPASASADPVVSPADTIRQALNDYLPDGFRDEDGVWHDGPVLQDALAALDALLAVGERDRRQIARLTARLEVVKGNVYLWQIGELVARDALNAIVADSASRRTAQTSERERDRRQIARLTEVLAFYADPASYENETPRHVRPVITDQGSRARAVLAGEEDAG